MQSESIADLTKALSKVQSELTGALKDSTNPYFKSKYADLESVWNAIRLPLTKNDLCVIQTTEMREGVIGLTTTLSHISGQFISGFYPLSAVKNDPQSVGSAMTYARRYTLAAIVGVVQTDDDGEAAMNREGTQSHHSVSRETISVTERLVEDRHLQKLTNMMIKLKADTAWINKMCENLFKTSPRGLKVSQFNEFMTVLETMKTMEPEEPSAV